jgi:hypothetical protein
MRRATNVSGRSRFRLQCATERDASCQFNSARVSEPSAISRLAAHAAGASALHPNSVSIAMTETPKADDGVPPMGDRRSTTKRPRDKGLAPYFIQDRDRDRKRGVFGDLRDQMLDLIDIELNRLSCSPATWGSARA